MGRRGDNTGNRNSNGRRPGSSGDQRSGGSRRIPPPPDRRGGGSGRAYSNRGADPVWDDHGSGFDDIVIERVDTAGKGGPSKGARSSKSSERRRGRPVSVDDVHMGDLAAGTASKLQNRLAEAARAFDRERFTEAERLLLSIQKLAPDVPEVHELLGLTQYRLGRWQKAIVQLERFNALTHSVEQHPVLADCYRAQRRWSDVERLWDELGQASPGPELVEEGRIVRAGALAEQGQLAEAIRFLERAPKVKGKAKGYQLRRWYAMADLYERAGDTARARRLFADIAEANPGFGDAAERASGL